MSNMVRVIQNICGGIAKSSIAKVGLAESVNMYPEIQQNDDQKSASIIIRSVQGEVLASNISGRCRN